MITSAQNPRVQHLRELLSRRAEREKAAEFVIEGVRLAEEALQSGWQPKMVLYSSELSARGMQLVQACLEKQIQVEELSPQLLKSSADTENSQGILMVLAARKLAFPRIPTFLLVADTLRDPGNLGTLLRSAAAAGAQGVLLSHGTTDPFAPKVLRAAMGAHFRLPIHQSADWDEIRRLCRPCQMFLAEAAQGRSCWNLDLRQPVALVVGSEADGVSPEARRVADGSISIPMPGQSESLNAAAAASILLFEVVRQRSQ